MIEVLEARSEDPRGRWHLMWSTGFGDPVSLCGQYKPDEPILLRRQVRDLDDAKRDDTCVVCWRRRWWLRRGDAAVVRCRCGSWKVDGWPCTACGAP